MKSVCYPESTKFSSRATTWGCEHEKKALEEYQIQAAAQHQEVDISESGLVVHPSFPHLGASPDGLVSCKCCGKGVFEIKCPYSCRDSTLGPALQSPKFCLGDNESGAPFLKPDHSYHYQVQLQMLLCQRVYSDFVIYTAKELAVVRVLPDADFISSAVAQVTTFYKLAVLPELVGKYFSKTFPEPLDDTAVSGTQHHPCCDAECPESDCITCANSSCPVKVFHLSCLRMKSLPKRKWFCHECKKQQQREKALAKQVSAPPL